MRGGDRGTGRPALWLAAALVVLLLPAPAVTARSRATPAKALVLATPYRPLTTLRRPLDADAVRLASVLSTANRYALGEWWDDYMAELEPYQSARETLSSEEVRRFASYAFSLGVALASRAHDVKLTGVPKADATAKAVQLVQFLVRSHRATLGDEGWGGSWQSALWAALAGHGGWLLGDAVPLPDRLALARMLEFEAEAVTARPMRYYRDRDGTVLTPGNTGAEEVAWDGFGAYVAAELLPHHPRRPVWTQAAHLRMVAAYARPSDLANGRFVNGKPVYSWLAGSNAENDGTVVNHQKINPDYMACVGLNLAATTVAPLVGDAVPEAARFNATLVYGAMQRLKFRPGGYSAPGGTIYVPGSGRIYYPQGTSFGDDRHVVFAALDEQVAALRLDAGLPTPARTWARLHLEEVRRMQARSDNGRTYQAGDRNTYPLREEQVGLYVGWAYLTRWVAHNTEITWTDEPWYANAPE